MSASLVGSEMCIRDSPGPPEKHLRRARQPAVVFGVLSCLELCRSGRWGCLLYTSDAADDM
eukprot:10463468-Alexandrium_andersonii.AAC.1